MSALAGKTLVVIGGSRVVGRRIVEAGVRNGARVLAAARQEASLRQLAEEGAGAKVLALDATDEAAPGKVFDDSGTGYLVVSAGAFPPAAPLHEQSWPEFAVNWETDVKIAFHFCKAALTRPLPAGASVILVSSGVAFAGSPISGGYAGAKAHSAVHRELRAEGIGSIRARLALHGARTPDHARHRARKACHRRLFPLSWRIPGRLHSGHRFAADLIRCRERSRRVG